MCGSQLVTTPMATAGVSPKPAPLEHSRYGAGGVHRVMQCFEDVNLFACRGVS